MFSSGVSLLDNIKTYQKNKKLKKCWDGRIGQGISEKM
jgi:hypothetical protein